MRILVDFDNTIALSQQAVIDVMNKRHKTNYSVNLNELEWNFENVFPDELKKEAISCFDNKEFYDALKIMPDAKNVLEDLSKKHEIIIVTKHSSKGILYKSEWIKENLPFIKRTIYLDQDDFDKSFISGDVLIDDRIDCLLNRNGWALLFGNYTWNQYSDKYAENNQLILRVQNWKDIKKFLSNLN